MAKRIKRLYVTTDWQTEGIVLRKCVAGDTEDVWLDDERVQLYSLSNQIIYTLGRDAFETEDEARAAVQAAARKKVESLRERADKIEQKAAALGS